MTVHGLFCLWRCLGYVPITTKRPFSKPCLTRNKSLLNAISLIRSCIIDVNRRLQQNVYYVKQNIRRLVHRRTDYVLTNK